MGHPHFPLRPRGRPTFFYGLGFVSKCLCQIAPIDEREKEATVLFSFGFMSTRDRVLLGGKKLWLLDYHQPVEPTLADENPVVAARFLESSCTIITAAGRSVKV